ncbi:MAG: TIGR04282 family arsenosugar biosynthesis glycosyltransferase [Acidobacteriota bacterium]
MRPRPDHPSTRPDRLRRKPRRTPRLCPAVVMLARAPREGRVKTRLASALGRKQALALHEAFLLDTLVWLRPLARAGWRVRLEWSEPFRPRGELRKVLRGIPCGTQPAGGLGTRIESALRRALDAGATCALVIGSDSPHIGAEPLRRTRTLLRCSDVVLGPALDGGYYLVGVRRVRRRWFRGIRWGTARVLRQTLSRLRADSARTHLLERAQDLDTPANLRELQKRLERSPALGRRLRFTKRALEEKAQKGALSRARRNSARR